ncbi:PREDICTED: shikimate O-hydroxycinnamoyltransferase-like [Nelumbo nucifera]|uniref:Shikimate O-hydroxycinnamoyltransferase-like n=2 Tax=Nelumbo nucifera TaxID=4432 RepID=A0A1U8AZI4_NELNU|nr:PREDICTED: shikimate O-hydroxycinnamoyltransferase-like [Nelumbo nucifera]DAD45357.1 TPA_asm: hypothetical protein HUJ06_003587 [Nelumbo nucifera]
MVKVTLKSTYTVKPIESTPIHRLDLSEIDQAKAWTHSPTVYFYRPNGQPNFFSAETVKTALSQALVQFYPLAGRIEKDKEGRLELNCNEKGALFVEAKSDSDIDDLGDFAPTSELRGLVPYVDYNETHISEWPLVLVQITSFRCGGICLGLGISHIVADGAAAMLFVTSWAQIARTGSNVIGPKLMPFIDRTVLRARVRKDAAEKTTKFDHIEYKRPPVLVSQVDETEELKKETTVAVLKLSQYQVESLKRRANEGTMDEREYTRYETLAGHMWKCASEARGLVDEQETKVHVSVDCRRRLRPALPANYFGNATFPTTPVAKAGDLISKPLSYAASKIREGVRRMTDEYVRSAVDFLGSQRDWSQFRTSFHSIDDKAKLGAYYGCPNLAITSWIGLPLYTADFGWGQPFHMGPTSLGADGKAYVISTEDDGIIVYLRLQTEHMEKFKELFYEDL